MGVSHAALGFASKLAGRENDMEITMLKQYKPKNFKFILVMYVVLLNTLGVLLVGSASPGDQNKQLLGMLSGLALMLVIAFIDYNFILRFAWLLYLLSILMLILVRFAGDGSKGAQRWFEIGSFRFQPSELVKILMILFFAYYFMKHEEKINRGRTIFSSLVLIGIPLALIVMQPNLSMTIIIAMVFAAMLFFAGISYKLVLGVLLTCVPSALVLITLIIQDKVPFIRSYQLGRIMAWLYPQDYPDIAYQQQNSIMAIGSGLLWGKGLNNSNPTSVKNGKFILEPQNDFIFAVAGEELGFIGTAAIIILLLFITIECIFIARKAKDSGGRLICCGMGALIGFQTIVNIGVASGLLPNTGVTLPFVSYGLTSLWSLYIGLGVVLNVGLQPKKY